MMLLRREQADTPPCIRGVANKYGTFVFCRYIFDGGNIAPGRTSSLIRLFETQNIFLVKVQTVFYVAIYVRELKANLPGVPFCRQVHFRGREE